MEARGVVGDGRAAMRCVSRGHSSPRRVRGPPAPARKQCWLLKEFCSPVKPRRRGVARRQKPSYLESPERVTAVRVRPRRPFLGAQPSSSSQRRSTGHRLSTHPTYSRRNRLRHERRWKLRRVVRLIPRRLVPERYPVDAMPLVGRRREALVLEDVSEVSVALRADDLDAHAIGVGNFTDRAGNSVVKSRPAATTIELRPCKV